MSKEARQDVATWIAVALLSVAAPVVFKILAAHVPSKSLREFAASS